MRKTHWYIFSTIMIIGVVLGVLSGASKKVQITSEMEKRIKTAIELSLEPEIIVDEGGKQINESSMHHYKERLCAVFDEKCAMVQRAYDAMQLAYNNYDEHSDVVINNDITSFYPSLYEESEDGKTAKVAVDTHCIQRCVQFEKDTERFRAVIAAIKATYLIELEKDNNNQWKIIKFDMSNYEFGSPKEMKITTKNYERTFSSREEAIEYLNRINIEKEFER